mmetsp:Transcript_18069/g.54070  ORF Transcript_18069/g.54070 Transcript_18069/m.54070 type:complete len:111 (-) Transcript_18069:56-388(-)
MRGMRWRVAVDEHSTCKSETSEDRFITTLEATAGVKSPVIFIHPKCDHTERVAHGGTISALWESQQQHRECDSERRIKQRREALSRGGITTNDAPRRPRTRASNEGRQMG